MTVVNDLLPAMMAGARRAADERRRAAPAGSIERRVAARQPRGRQFLESLRAPGIRIIAECKRRSPSRGILREQYDPVAIARSYEAAGAAAISVLTDAGFFDGALAHLEAVREAVGLPILRKDFVSTPFQIMEARAAGADAVLLIVAGLDDQQLKELLGAAGALELAALVEIHDRDELIRALQAGATCVGVNSRNLRTLEMNPRAFEELVLGLPEDAIAVAESGIKDGGNVRQLRAVGYDAFLIGERFMAWPDPGAALAELRSVAAAEFEELR
jgi:indole-3-glycerol phosphate synthase